MSDYPLNWSDIAREIKEGAGWKCECCQMQFNTEGLALTEKRRDGRPFVLTVHHLNEIKADCRPENLVSLCQRCHYTIHIRRWKPGRPLPLALARHGDSWLSGRGLLLQGALI